MTPPRENVVVNSLPLSFAQQRLWFLNELDSDNAAYHLPRVIRISGALQVDALTAAVRALVARHQGLRTVFTTTEGVARQRILPAISVDLPLIDVQELPAAEREQEALRIAGEQANAPFDLACGPLLRLTLVRIEHDEHILILVMHHIITDGWSMGIFFRELTEFYKSFVDGHTPALPELTIEYTDFIHWQNGSEVSEQFDRQSEYWKTKLHGADQVLELPTDYARPNIHRGHGAMERLFLSESTTEGLKRLGQNEGATLFMTLLAAFQALLWRYTSQDTFMVGTPVAGRNELELEHLIGFFVNTLVLRADFASDPSVRELLKEVRNTCLEAYANQDVPFERLVAELKPERTLSQSPLFQVMLILHNTPPQKIDLQGLVLEELEFESGIGKFDLTLEIIEDNGLHCIFEYDADLFHGDTIKRMVEHFEALINGFVEDPESRVSSLPLLSDAERKQILTEWNKTDSNFPAAACIHTAFEEQAAKTPDAVAFLYNGNQLTYRELNERANRLAWHLIQNGVTPDTPVGIAIERSLEMMVGLLGILKAGAAYVPLDPSGPKERTALMLADSKVATIVTLMGLKDKLPAHSAQHVCLDGDQASIDAQSALNPNLPLSSTDVAYIMYTSGSTGIPKGVEGTHRASMNRFAWMWNCYPFGPAETCCQKTALTFIDSVWEIFGPLLRGVRNVIIPEESLLDPEQFIGILAKFKVTRIVLVPSLLRMLLENFGDLAAQVPNLKLWSASGEILNRELAERFRSAFPNATLLNIYGSSEVAADVTCHEVKEVETATVPIGRPISNTQIYILDRCLNVVPVGVRGEIHVGGACMARGYWNNPAATAERFVRSPFATDSRLYKTGDLGRWLPDGAIEYLGRSDNQIKLRGFRVELGEIESVLRAHPSIRDAAVVVHGEQQKLIAFVVARDGDVPSSQELGRFSRAKLPEHMVAATYVPLESMPTLPSGKINRKALAAMNVAPATHHTRVAPRTATEEILVQIWQEVLRVEQAGVEDNFFELGGHSLLAVQVTSRIRRILDVEMSVRSIFEHPLIADLALEVDRMKASGMTARMPRLTQRAPDPKAALLAQLDQLSPEEIRALLDDAIAKKSSAGRV